MLASEFLNKDCIITNGVLEPDANGEASVTFPDKAQLLDVGYAGKDVCVTALVNPANEPRNYRFKLVNSGSKFIYQFDLDFIGSAYPASDLTGEFEIVHVFRRKTSM